MTDVRAPQLAPGEATVAGDTVPGDTVPGDTAADDTAPTGAAPTGAATIDTAPTGAAPAGVPPAGWGWFRWAWRQLTSMRTALVLLFLLALGSVPGSVLPQQGQDPAAVQNYFTSHPTLAPWLNHLGLFNVFAAPWFAAIYLLLFASLVGCVVPRTFRLAGQSRTPPPRAPRNLGRLPHSASYRVAMPAPEALAIAAAALASKRFRLRTGGSRGAAADGLSGATEGRGSAAKEEAVHSLGGDREAAGGSRGAAADGLSGATEERGSAAKEEAVHSPGGDREAERPADGDGTHWISAEKGYLREAGNLLFHLALLGVLVSIAMGGLFGYKANKLLVEGQSFANTASALDEFHPGRLVSGSDLAPFSMGLSSFSASYYTSGESRGQPSSFDARISYSSSPGAPAKPYDLRINQPLNVDSLKVYLIGHGYAPVFKVTDATGKVVYDEATPFIPANTGTFESDGVVKVPDAAPTQLGFIGVFVPTALAVNGTLQSAFPAPYAPAVSLLAYEGNLGMNSGIPQSVYQLDTSAMTKVSAQPFLLQPGQSYALPGGKGKITFAGYKQWVSIAITHDPGQIPALVCGMLSLAGLLLSFLVRRRRVFVRINPDGDGSTVTVGGLARTDASGGFEDEFAELVAELRDAQRSAEGTTSRTSPEGAASDDASTKTGA